MIGLLQLLQSGISFCRCSCSWQQLHMTQDHNTPPLQSLCRCLWWLYQPPVRCGLIHVQHWLPPIHLIVDQVLSYASKPRFYGSLSECHRLVLGASMLHLVAARSSLLVIIRQSCHQMRCQELVLAERNGYKKAFSCSHQPDLCSSTSSSFILLHHSCKQHPSHPLSTLSSLTIPTQWSSYTIRQLAAWLQAWGRVVLVVVARIPIRTTTSLVENMRKMISTSLMSS